LGSGAAAMVDCWLRRSNNSCCLDGSGVVLVQLVAGSVGGRRPDWDDEQLRSSGLQRWREFSGRSWWFWAVTFGCDGSGFLEFWRGRVVVWWWFEAERELELAGWGKVTGWCSDSGGDDAAATRRTG